MRNGFLSVALLGAASLSAACSNRPRVVCFSFGSCGFAACEGGVPLVFASVYGVAVNPMRTATAMRHRNSPARARFDLTNLRFRGVRVCCSIAVMVALQCSQIEESLRRWQRELAIGDSVRLAVRSQVCGSPEMS